eukprot:3783572-Prymnesium_polylepis.2
MARASQDAAGRPAHVLRGLLPRQLAGACHIREGACHIREGACHIREGHVPYLAAAHAILGRGTCHSRQGRRLSSLLARRYRAAASPRAHAPPRARPSRLETRAATTARSHTATSPRHMWRRSPPDRMPRL